jgi:hypothetical protein
MARINNAINFGSGFNITAASPIDSRMLVQTITDLTDPNQWYNNSSVPCPVFTGMIVAVRNTGSIYTLKKVVKDGVEVDPSQAHRSISNWQEIGRESYTTETYDEAISYPNLKKGNLIWINQDNLEEDGSIKNKSGLYVVISVSTQVSAGNSTYTNSLLKIVTLDEFTDSLNQITARVEVLEEKIKGLSGALHFRGISSTDPMEEGGKIIINDVEVIDFIEGDVIIFESKEFIYSNNSWVELGDPTFLEGRVTAVEQNVSENNESITSLTTQLTWNEDNK